MFAHYTNCKLLTSVNPKSQLVPILIASISLSASFVAAQVDDIAMIEEERIESSRPDSSREYEIVDELIVSGQRENSIKPAMDILDGYTARQMGAYFYRLRMYDKAYPYLVEAAQEGFKMSQARLGFIYQQGLGSVERDWQRAVGWLGVAASPETHPEILTHWRGVKRRIPPERLELVEEIVEEYVDRYGAEATGVTCDLNRSAGTHISKIRCSYDDEIYYRDPGSDLNIPGVEIDTSVGGGGGGP